MIPNCKLKTEKAAFVHQILAEWRYPMKATCASIHSWSSHLIFDRILLIYEGNASELQFDYFSATWARVWDSGFMFARRNVLKLLLSLETSLDAGYSRNECVALGLLLCPVSL
ncbi:hypothetical protein R6Q59_022958 [Mikania micrantha]|uniref:Uncharacterized protein n=1 Tax=Mikania micrantha TaxID=192012 RepID=A0A5N6MYY3_9ASTR|nr:hypothetical protein E3N88_28022 [Mikania micrantha]